ncbi:hypothetical protein L6452_32818 [Arctium lappa]|uniref:Uncharacterized protein n=1 Tax=Arctium lappa TaxID=4217 RepID=A0ACB8Z4R7_ARCLA|nr:hypothetical protein L6452_32818 [Arctium lappa]
MRTETRPKPARVSSAAAEDHTPSCTSVRATAAAATPVGNTATKLLGHKFDNNVPLFTRNYSHSIERPVKIEYHIKPLNNGDQHMIHLLGSVASGGMERQNSQQPTGQSREVRNEKLQPHRGRRLMWLDKNNSFDCLTVADSGRQRVSHCFGRSSKDTRPHGLSRSPRRRYGVNRSRECNNPMARNGGNNQVTPWLEYRLQKDDTNPLTNGPKTVSPIDSSRQQQTTVTQPVT